MKRIVWRRHKLPAFALARQAGMLVATIFIAALAYRAHAEQVSVSSELRRCKSLAPPSRTSLRIATTVWSSL